MNFVWLFLCVAALNYGEVNGLAFDDLDFVRSTIEDAAKSITSKPPTKFVTLFKPELSVPAVRNRNHFFSVSYVPVPKPKLPKHALITTKVEFGTVKVGYNAKLKKPRNLNKFSEAMDQVERAMAQAGLSRKTVKLTVLRKDITNAVNRGNIR